MSPRNDGVAECCFGWMNMGVASDHTAAMGASSIRERREKTMFILNVEREREKEKEFLIGRMKNYVTR